MANYSTPITLRDAKRMYRNSKDIKESLFNNVNVRNNIPDYQKRFLFGHKLVAVPPATSFSETDFEIVHFFTAEMIIQFYEKIIADKANGVAIVMGAWDATDIAASTGNPDEGRPTLISSLCNIEVNDLTGDVERVTILDEDGNSITGNDSQIVGKEHPVGGKYDSALANQPYQEVFERPNVHFQLKVNS